MNPLLDNDFLIKLNNDRNRTIYAHVISLNQYEHPIEALEGVVTAGSITIDGQSAVRRTCSLTLSAKNLNINNVYWGLTTKVKIEIGVQNNIIGYKKYGDIIWFPQGIFILTDFKTTQTINNYTINVTGKDKMCLLNGDVSGNLPAPVIFDSYDDSSGQSGIVDANGKYNSFIDVEAHTTLINGLYDRYHHTDYTYIRTLGNIISLNLKTSNSIPNNAEITFSITPKDNSEWVSLKSVIEEDSLYTNPSKPNEKSYVINIGDKDILGFQVRNCTKNDEFTWAVRTKIPICLIIQEMIHQFGQEQYSNIIIRDIDSYGLEMLDNDSDTNYFLLHNGTTYTNFVSAKDLVENYSLYLTQNQDGDNTIPSIKDTNNNIIDIDDSQLILRKYIEEDDVGLVDILNGSTLSKDMTSLTQIIKKNDGLNTQNKKEIYTITAVRQKQVAGYGMTLLVYPDELKGEPGDSITSILDKIVNMLGNYEYFYDLNGQFIFQAKPAYLKTAWNKTIELNEDMYIDPSELYKRVAYTFDNAVLTTQYQNNPNMNNIKNDYIIWGERKNLSGNSVKFHGRYAINNVPLEYTDFKGYTWTSNKRESLLKAIEAKVSEATHGYKHIYNYPKGLLESGWWEINDWANYYSSIFNIDLSKNGTMMQFYSKINKAGTTRPDICRVNRFGKFFEDYVLDENLYRNDTLFTDVITITFSDRDKTNIINFRGHGQCTHYYYQFMDLRLLGDGWTYAFSSTNNNNSELNIINTINPEQVYELEDRVAPYQWGYNPDFTTSFIFDPVLPSDTAEELLNYYTDLIYPNAKNENGASRQYALSQDVDWRHLIHVMADDWYAHNHEDDFEINLRKNNSWQELNIDLFPYGRTNFEQYYLDFTSIGGFWQDIYNIYQVKKDYFTLHTSLQSLYEKEYEEVENQLALMSDDRKAEFYSGGQYKYWHKDVIEDPENLLFWFDFFEADDMGIGKFAVSVIGDRPKTINDSNIKVIVYEDTPDVIYCAQEEYDFYKEKCALKDGYQYIIISNQARDSMIRTIRAKSVHQQANDMLYQYSYYNDTVNISAVPIYYLQPNTIISIKDELSKIIGYYVMNKINISLAYNGMMQITAIKSPQKIY